MATIYTRASKGSALTWAEGDANVTNLNNAKLENVVEDLTPQLGGNLDVNGNSIVSTSNANIEIAPNGTGDVYLTADTIRVGDSNANATVTTNGTGDLILNTNSGTNSGAITIQDGIDGDITVVPNGIGKVHFETSETRVGINDTNAKITTKGTGDLTLDTNSGTNSGSITIADGVNGNISITPNGTGSIVLDGLNWPQADGTADYVLKTNGAGQLSWVAQPTDTNTTYSISAETATGGVNLRLTGSDAVTDDVKLAAGSNITLTRTDASTITIAATDTTGITSVSADTTPKLGGNLDVQTYKIISTSNGNIEIEPNGTGDVYLTADTVRIGDSNANATITTNGTGDLILNTNNGTNSGSITIQDAANGNIQLSPNGTGMTMLDNIEYHEKIHSLGTTSGTITPDAANGNVQKIELNGNLTFSAFSNPITGQSITLIVDTNGTGRTLTSTMKFAGGSKTLSTTDTFDIISVFYDGTNYYASLAKDFK